MYIRLFSTVYSGISLSTLYALLCCCVFRSKPGLLSLRYNMWRWRRMSLCNNVLGRRWRRYLKKNVFFFLLSVIIFFQIYSTTTMPVRYLFINEDINKECIIPDLDPFDTSIMKYVWSPEPIQCDPTPDLAFVNKEGYLVFNESAFQYYDEKDFKCSYAPLVRKDDYSVYFGPDIEVTLPVKVPHDFFRIRCYKKNGNSIIYETLAESVYVTDKDVNPKGNERPFKYSVLMFGIDSTSRLSALRKLPKTYEYLTKTLGAHVFRGYMKVGDNTFPNLVPVLTGKRPWTSDLPNPDKKKYNVKDFAIIWENFSRENYATFYAEDHPTLATFNTEASGFDSPPTGHYMRPWMHGLRKMAFSTDLLRNILLNIEYSHMKISKTSYLCYGTKPIFKHLINYYKRFATIYKSKLKFGFSWMTQICHEFINYLELGDNDFFEFFKFLNDEGHLDYAFLIFFSDHGSRLDDIRNTFIGRIEERMPLLSIVPPKSFVKEFPETVKTLKENTAKLTSNFDLHETLKDILLGNFYNTERFRRSDQRGTSLFKPISSSRSCADASIPEHFCACYGSTEKAINDPLVEAATSFAVSQLNSLLKNYKDICAELSLAKIVEAREISLGLSARGHEETRLTIYRLFSTPEKVKHKRFLVVFETLPGYGLFEATVDYHVDSGMQINDDISRTNKYGNTSVCVPEKPLQRYCFCKSLLKH